MSAGMEPLSLWFCKVFDSDVGPVTLTTLRQLAKKGMVLRDTPIRPSLSDVWTSAKDIDGLFPLTENESVTDSN